MITTFSPNRAAVARRLRPFRLAVQKSGRLTDDSLRLLRECGLSLGHQEARLVLPAANLPLDVLFLRDDDICDAVASGVADAGILGDNVVTEHGCRAMIVRRLGFARCRLSIAMPRGMGYSGPNDLQGLRIATSYPRLLNDFLRRQGIEADVHEISGSVEIAPSIGLADAICDLVSSGSTLLMNGLREVETVMQSEAVVIVNDASNEATVTERDRLLFRIDAVLRARSMRAIFLNAPNDALGDIIRLLPGLQSPTVMPLARPDWSSVHAVIPEDRFWDIIDELRTNGAEGILVTPIEKLIE